MYVPYCPIQCSCCIILLLDDCVTDNSEANHMMMKTRREYKRLIIDLPVDVKDNIVKTSTISALNGGRNKKNVAYPRWHFDANINESCVSFLYLC